MTKTIKDQAELCKHTNIEVYEDADVEGSFWAECQICSAQSESVESVSKAKQDIFAQQVERPHRVGGKRVGAGRPRVLSEKKTLLAAEVEPKHLKNLTTYQKKLDISSKSAAVRDLLTRIPEFLKIL